MTGEMAELDILSGEDEEFDRLIGNDLIDAAISKTEATHCNWRDDGNGNDTDCGHCFMVNEGSPSDNGMKYCCYCGKPIKETHYEDEDLSDE